MNISRDTRIALIATIILAVAVATGPPWWFKLVFGGSGSTGRGHPGTTVTNATATHKHRSSHPPAVSTRYVDGLRQIYSSDVKTGVVNIDGRSFGDGLSIDTTLDIISSPPHTVIFALSGTYDRFRAILGVDPTSAPGFSGSFTVQVLGAAGADATNLNQTLAQATVASSSPPCSLDAPLAGVRTLGLTSSLASGEPMTVTFGKARVVRGADLSRMPSAPPC